MSDACWDFPFFTVRNVKISYGRNEILQFPWHILRERNPLYRCELCDLFGIHIFVKRVTAHNTPSPL